MRFLLGKITSFWARRGNNAYFLYACARATETQYYTRLKSVVVNTYAKNEKQKTDTVRDGAADVLQRLQRLALARSPWT